MNDQSPVAHLHTHTEYSALDGIGKLDVMCRAAADDGQPAIAITDHGSLGGTWKFNAAARAAGIKPIIGMEAYLAVGSRFERNPLEGGDDGADTDADDVSSESEDGDPRRKKKRGKPYQHLTVLVESPAGWTSLVRASNASQCKEAIWYKPRMDLDLLRDNAEGLIILTGCLGGPVASHLIRGDREQAEANLRTLIGNHGRGNVFVEVMDHGIPAEHKVMSGLVELAARYDLPVVATNDAHYTHTDDAGAHECWLCIGQHGKNMSSEKRWKFQGSGYHLRTSAEMHALFDTQPGTGQAVANTLLIADRVADNVLPESRLRLPKYPCPDGLRSAEYLHQLVLEGAKRRYGSPLPAEVRTRLRYEENVVVGAGLEDYLLIVWDILNATRAAGHRVGYGRGSASGCALSYCLGIVGVDPIRYNLLFERFLNPERAGMPDIDSDFDSEGRDFAIRYTIDKYGQNMVAKIGTYGLALSKKAVRDVARITMVAPTGNKLSNMIPSVAGKPMPLADLVDETNPLGASFRDVLASDPFAPEVVNTASVLEGVIATEGVHACGVLISDEPMDTFVPLRPEKKKSGTKIIYTGVNVTQWDGKDVDAAGLLKKDFLGLRNLDVVTHAVTLIERTTGEVVDTDGLPDPDDSSHPRVRRAWEMLAAGKTAGVFQLESAGITKLCEQIVPTSLNDLAAVIALYRPGPLGMGMHEHYAARKAGIEPVDYAYLTTDPAEQAVIASVLDETYGVIVYQESLMRLAVVVAGFNPGQSNKLQKAFSKKIREQMDQVGHWFHEGGRREVRDEAGTVTKIAFSDETLERLWITFSSSADYIFNKSHATGYGYLCYVTAFLKANWPAQYGAALLSVTKIVDRRLPVLNALADEGISVMAPDVNLGRAVTSVDRDGNVRLGMSEVKGVGEHAEFIVTERDANGPYAGLADLLNRVKVVADDGSTSNIPTNLVAGLIEAGACDCFGPRMGQAAALLALRDAPDTVVPDIEWGVVERAQRQRLRLGAVTTSHPLAALGEQLRAWREPGRGTKPVPLHRIEAGDGDYITTLGVVASFAQKTYRSGQMANIILEGSHGSLPCVAWNEAMQELTATDAIPLIGEVVAVTGRVKVRTLTIPVGTDGQDVEQGLEDGLDAYEEITRRELAVNKLWRGPLTDEAGTLPRDGVVEVRPASGPGPRKPKPSRTRKPIDLGGPPPDDIPKCVGGPEQHAEQAVADMVTIPLRREDAGPATIIRLRAGSYLYDQLMDQNLGQGQLGMLQAIVPGLATDEAVEKLQDWLLHAEPGQQSAEYICRDGSALVFEACERSPKLRELRPLLRRMLASAQPKAS